MRSCVLLGVHFGMHQSTAKVSVVQSRGAGESAREEQTRRRSDGAGYDANSGRVEAVL